MSRKRALAAKFPPSVPCTCEVCQSYCKRPGWWTVEEAAAAMAAGYGDRMMLEMSPGRSFGVLAPAFKGCEAAFAIDLYAAHGCTFLKEHRCELHGTGFEPLECRFCHHDRPGLGERCHAAIETDWNSPAGRKLVVQWSNETDFWKRLRTANSN